MISLMKGLSYELDLFKISINLFIDKKPQNSTYLGAFISILIYFVLYISFSQSDMIKRTNPYIFEKSIYDKQSPNIIIGDNFQYVFGLSDNIRQGYKDDSIFQIEAYIITQIGSKIVNISKIPTRSCTEKDLSNFNYTNYSMFNCLESNLMFNLSGTFAENEFTQLSFVVRICNNETDNKICKSEEEIKNFMIGKLFGIFYPQFVYDFDKYKNPFSIMSTLDYVPINLNSVSIKQIFYKKIIFQDDDYWIFKNNNQDYFYSKNNEINLNHQFESLKSRNSLINPLTVINFQSNKEILFIARKYQKLQEVLANVSGLANTLIFLGFFFTSLSSKLKFIRKILNSLIIFNTNILRNNENNTNNTNQNSLRESPLKQIRELKNNNIELKKCLDENKIQDKELILNTENQEENKKLYMEKLSNFEKYCKFKINKINISFSFFEYIFTIIKSYTKRKLKHRDKIILKAENMFENEIDIITILKKIQEIDYLKKLLLSKSQLSLFYLLVHKDEIDDISFDKKNKEILLKESLTHYSLLLNKEPKSFIDITFLELLNENIKKTSEPDLMLESTFRLTEKTSLILLK